ncbi:MAG: bifunctional folylpolyglutamate synthase/dihydrofolate synthase [Acidobacteria bacterium]|nr:MAG: bifunctional folylpolyglutamate synthase/dihydrofolate synthase [Acidobacteriota bacterium]
MKVGGASVPRLSPYKETLAWIYGLQRFGIKLGLENIQRLIAALHVDLGGARVIHVAGTNGKGSVCAMIDSILRAQKYRTGLFTSPHLVTFRERVRVDGEMISEDGVANGLTAIRNLVRDWEPHPTFFEIATALALKHFSNAKIDIVILETGLGGRLDATNAVQPNVSIITPIDLDHQQWLGESLEEIAHEKAGIIKPRIPVVAAAQAPDAEKVIRDRAVECQAPLQFVNDSYHKSTVGLPGEHQKQNAALAIAAIARGLASVDWPARFQRWDDRIVIDGAHNPAAAQVLAQTWQETFGDQRASLILAILSDKDLRGICEALAPIADSVFLPKIRTDRAFPPDELAKVLCASIPSLPYCTTQSIADAFDQARAKPNRILLTGSLHFAGEVLAWLQCQPAAFEECAQ